MKLSQVLKFVKTSLNLVSREVWSYPTVKFSRPMVIVLAAFNCAVVSPVWVNDFCLCSQYTGNEKLKTRKQDLFDQNMNAVILTGETSPPKSKDKRWVFKACKINCRGKKCICLSFYFLCQTFIPPCNQERTIGLPSKIVNPLQESIPLSLLSCYEINFGHGEDHAVIFNDPCVTQCDISTMQHMTINRDVTSNLR